MTTPNISAWVKSRISAWLRRLLDFANNELKDLEDADSNHFHSKVETSWQEQQDSHDLIVKTQLAVLIELLAPVLDSNRKLQEQKADLRNDLYVLRDWLGLLEDCRVKRQGSAEWHFILKLWSTQDTDKNLLEFERHWERCQQLKSDQPSSAQSHPQTKTPVGDSAGATTAELPEVQPNDRPLPSNLPAPPHTAFIGLKTHITRLLKLLSFDHPTHRISIEGAAGIGKTTLVLEAAHRCLKATPTPQAHPGTPTFDAIIFTSAQAQQLMGPHLCPRLLPEQNLRDIFKVIMQTLNHFDPLPPTLEKQVQVVRDSLRRQSTLLIVDNLETLSDQEATLAFLREVPPTVKVVITSRVRTGLGTGSLRGDTELKALLYKVFTGLASKTRKYRLCKGLRCFITR